MLRIRPFEWKDVEEINKKDNDPEVTRFLGAIPPISLEQTYENFRRMTENSAILLVAEEDGKFAGSLEILMEKGKFSHVGTIGFSLKKECWGRGIGTKLAEEGIKKARELGLKKLITYIFEPNEKSIDLIKRLGFEEVGRFKQHIFLDGRYYDELIFEKLL